MSKTRFDIWTTFRAMDKFSGPVARMTTRMDRFRRATARGMRGIQRNTKRMARGMRSLALSMGSLIVASGFGLKGLLGPAAKFEHAMSGVNAVTLGQIENMDELKQKAKDLGRTTTFTAVQVGQAMEILARAGLKGGEIDDAIEPILKAAEAGGAGIDETAKVIISTMKGMGWEFAKTTDAANIFALISARTKTTITELGEGMSKVAPVAKQFGLKFEEVAATVALLQDVGIEASMSGTQMKTMLTKLAQLTPKATKRFKRLGIVIEDGVSGNMKQLPELIAAIGEGLSKAGGNMDKVGAIAAAVGLRGATAANQLVAAWESGRLDELLTEIRNRSDTVAGDMAEMRLDNLVGDMIKLKSAWETFRIDIASGNLPELRDLVQSITEWLSKPETISKFAGIMERMAKSFKEFWKDNKSFILSALKFGMNMAKMMGGMISIVWTILKPVRSLLNIIMDIVNFLAEKFMFKLAGALKDHFFFEGLGNLFDFLGSYGQGDDDSPGSVGLPPELVSSSPDPVTGSITIFDKTGDNFGVESASSMMSLPVRSGG